ncbi:MAG: UvrD-helicase domain-containing protein, partial [Candidatus Magasanikbacteria bacterium]
MDIFKKRYNRLNSAQKEAVDSIEGPVLVVAGPGSGKTELLSLRTANILRKTDVFPGNILCLTFTDSASVNMKKRLEELIGQDGWKVSVHTFHDFGVEIMNRYPEFFYEGAVFSSADDLTQKSLLGDIFKGMSHDNPLSSHHPDYGFVYLESVQSSIKDLKKAGITPDEFRQILEHNDEVLDSLNPLIEEAFGSRVSKNTFKKVDNILEKIREMEFRQPPVSHIKPLNEVLEQSLQKALNKALKRENTPPLSQWKKNWTGKNEEGKRVLKDSKYSARMKSLAEVYDEYKEKMYSKGYYDFDDMILDVIQAIEEKPDLRDELREEFLYIMVDEFQDSNDAQMRLLNLIASPETQEARPNVLAVGDDDQAIYKFQGAEISNIVRFKEYYRDPKIISLQKNYRSRQEILELSKSIIRKGEERLENLLEGVDKDLMSALERGSGELKNKVLETELHERAWVAKKCRELIEKNSVEPQDIAVIARRHSHLKDIVPYFLEEDINISYERKRNVLEEPHIRQLIKMARFVSTILDKDKEEADDLLVDILSFPFWDIDRKTLWGISRKSYEEQKLWIECMQEKGGYLQEVANFFLRLAKEARYQSAENILDKMIGEEDKELEKFSSPFKKYYFGKSKLDEETGEYIRFLSSLRTFIEAIRDYKKEEFLDIEDLIEFVDIHEENDIPLTDEGSFLSDKNSVELLTAHKAKGREFDTVFIIHCQNDVWAKSRSYSKLSFPKNLSISPSQETKEDQLRVFYTAITRAKRNLYLSSYEFDEKNERVESLEFLPVSEEGIEDDEVQSDNILEVDKENEIEEVPEIKEKMIENSLKDNLKNFEGKEEALLKDILEDYKLNVTHFNNFLNVADGGPRNFFENNLLRFPQPKTPRLSYGTAMHSTIQKIYLHLKNKGDLPSWSRVSDWFKQFLRKERLSDRDFEKYLEKGLDHLEVYYREKRGEFDPSHKVEFSFRDQGVVCREVPLRGKIDRMVIGNSEVEVHDFKTGSYLEDWGGKTKWEKIKSWKYRNQLIFYKILVENSREFSGQYEVNEGMIEFLEPREDGTVVSLPLAMKKEEVKRIKELIVVVYKKIRELDFPSVSDYSDDIKGIKNFESDLLF